MIDKDTIRKMSQFFIVGLLGLIIDYGVTFLCKEELHFNKYIANSLGFICAASSNYFLNKKWTFNQPDKYIVKQHFSFLLVSGIGLCINLTIIWLLTQYFFHLNFYLAKLIAIGCVFFWNFFMSSRIVFKAK